MFNDTMVGCDILTTTRKDFVRHYKGEHGVYLPQGQGLLAQAKDDESKSRKHKPSLIALMLHWVKSSGAFEHAEDQNLFIISDRIKDADNQLWMGVILSGFIVPTGSRLMNYADDGFNEIYAGDMCLSEADFLTKVPLLGEHFKRYLTKQKNQNNKKDRKDQQDQKDQTTVLSVVLDVADESLLNEIEDEFKGVHAVRLEIEQINQEIKSFPRKAVNSCALKPIKGVVPVKTITLAVATVIGAYFGYGYYQDRQIKQQEAQAQAERTAQSIKIKKLKDLQNEKTFYERLTYLNASKVLAVILEQLPTLIYLQNGWQLSSVEFKEENLDQLWLTYQRGSYGSMGGLLALYKDSAASSILVTDQNANQAKFAVSLNVDHDKPSPYAMTRQVFTDGTLRLSSKNDILDAIQRYALSYQIQPLKALENASLNMQIQGIVAQAKANLYFEQLKVTGEKSIRLNQLLNALSKTQFTTIQSLIIQFDTKQMSVINNFQFTGVTYG